MDKTNSKEATIQPAYTKEEIINLLWKAQHDYNMIDSKIKEMLNVENINIKEFREVASKIYELNYDLIECAEMRNKKIEELMGIIK
jgi:hypothetical protein